MWFSSAAAKRLTGRHFDLNAHVQLALQRDRERRAERQAEADARQHATFTAEMASSRVAQRKERDRAVLTQRSAAQQSGRDHGRRLRHRTAAAADQWLVDSSFQPAAVVVHPLCPASPASPPPRLHRLSTLVAPPIPQALVECVVRAVRFGDTAALQHALSAQPPSTSLVLVNLTTAVTHSSLLHLALSLPSPSVPVLSLLVSHGADPNRVDHRRCTPLHAACGRRLYRVIKLLVAAGADVEVVNERGELCFEVDGVGEDSRKMRTVVALLKGEREGDAAAREREEQRRDEEDARLPWRARTYEEQRRAGMRRGREWTAQREQRRSAQEQQQRGDALRVLSPRSRSIEDTAAQEVGQSEERTATASSGEESFASFAERALRDEQAVLRCYMEDRKSEAALLHAERVQSHAGEDSRALTAAARIPQEPRVCAPGTGLRSSRVRPWSTASAAAGRSAPLPSSSTASSSPSSPPLRAASPIAFFSRVFVSGAEEAQGSAAPLSAAARTVGPSVPRTPSPASQRPQTAPLMSLRSAPSIPCAASTRALIAAVRGRAVRPSAG